MKDDVLQAVIAGAKANGSWDARYGEVSIKEALAQPEQEPVAWMNNKDFEPIRVRIMQEAYELADRNDSESYNAIKVMCGDVQRMLPPKRPWVDLSDSQIEQVYYDVAKLHRGAPMPWGQVQFGNALQALVKEKNNG